jgi:hypothetical protein
MVGTVGFGPGAKIDYTEKNDAEIDPTLAAFVPVRARLSMLAWSAYAEPMNCDCGPLSRIGVMTIPMDDDLGETLMAAFTDSHRPS